MHVVWAPGLGVHDKKVKVLEKEMFWGRAHNYDRRIQDIPGHAG
jgi:hypothetical protein